MSAEEHYTGVQFLIFRSGAMESLRQNNPIKFMVLCGLLLSVLFFVQLSARPLIMAKEASTDSGMAMVGNLFLYDVTPCNPGFVSTPSGCVPGGNVTGTLTAVGSNNSPISGAQVILKKFKASKTTNTSADGSFSFTNLEPGNYSEVFIVNGFFISSVDVVVASGRTTTSNTALVPQIRVATTCGAGGMINWLLSNDTSFTFVYTYAILNSNISGSGTLNPGVNTLKTAAPNTNGANFLQINIAGMRAGGGGGSASVCGTATLTGQVTALSTNLVAAITNSPTVCPKISTVSAERLMSSAAPATTVTNTACTQVPVIGASVSLRDDTGADVGSAVTDNNGNYVFSNITISSPHTYGVKVSATNYLTANRPIRLSAVGANILNIQLIPVPPPITFATIQIKNACTPVVSSSLNSVQIVDASNGQLLYQGFTDSKGYFVPTNINGIIVPNPISATPVNFIVPIPLPQGHALTVKVSGSNGPVSLPAITTKYTFTNPVKIIVFINGTTCP
jgi:hypothetical protein